MKRFEIPEIEIAKFAIADDVLTASSETLPTGVTGNHEWGGSEED